MGRGGRVGKVGNLAPYSNTHTLQASPQENVGEGGAWAGGLEVVGGGGDLQFVAKLSITRVGAPC